VEAKIADRLARKPPSRSVTARVFTLADGHSVRVELLDGSSERSERTFVAPTCEAAAEAVAVILALAASESDSDVAAAAVVGAPREPDGARPMSKTPDRNVRASLYGAVALDSSSLPHPAPGLLLGIEARRGVFTGGVTAGGWTNRLRRGRA
jgi:hypothetical protein